jgi:hypothetical protein
MGRYLFVSKLYNKTCLFIYRKHITDAHISELSYLCKASSNIWDSSKVARTSNVSSIRTNNPNILVSMIRAAELSSPWNTPKL